MLCSKSSSNWLDRLRISKGFHIPSHLDLDQFLTSDPNPHPTLSDLPVENPPIVKPSLSRRPMKPAHTESGIERKNGGEKEKLFDLMSNVLAELFIIGDPQDLPSIRTLGERKSFRKQPNPKVCVPSASGSVDVSFSAGAPEANRDSAMSPSSADHSVAEAKKSRTKVRRKRGSGGPVDSDLSAYSRTEVTVIDTSAQAWKSEKLIFRKGMVWKVRDKKLWNVCRKKRKLGLVERLISEKEKEHPLVDFKASARREHLESVVEVRIY